MGRLRKRDGVVKILDIKEHVRHFLHFQSNYKDKIMSKYLDQNAIFMGRCSGKVSTVVPGL